MESRLAPSRHLEWTTEFRCTHGPGRNHVCAIWINNQSLDVLRVQYPGRYLVVSSLSAWGEPFETAKAFQFVFTIYLGKRPHPGRGSMATWTHWTMT